MQTAKDVSASQDALNVIFEQIENFFKRLEEYAQVPTTETMQDIIVRIMAEVLEIFAIMTAEINEGQSGESDPDDMSPIADRGSEKSLKELNESKDITDALSRLDGLTREAIKMATMILDIVDHFTGGTFSTLPTQQTLTHAIKCYDYRAPEPDAGGPKSMAVSARSLH